MNEAIGTELTVRDYLLLANQKNLIWTGMNRSEQQFPASNLDVTTWQCHRGHRLTASYVVMRDGFPVIDASARSEADRAAMARFAFGPKTIRLTEADNGRTLYAIMGDQFKLVLLEESILHRSWQLESITGTSIRHGGPHSFQPHDYHARPSRGDYISYLDPVGVGLSVVKLVCSTLSGNQYNFEVTIHVIGGLHCC